MKRTDKPKEIEIIYEYVEGPDSEAAIAEVFDYLMPKVIERIKQKRLEEKTYGIELSTQPRSDPGVTNNF